MIVGRDASPPTTVRHASRLLGRNTHSLDNTNPKENRMSTKTAPKTTTKPAPRRRVKGNADDAEAARSERAAKKGAITGDTIIAGAQAAAVPKTQLAKDVDKVVAEKEAKTVPISKVIEETNAAFAAKVDTVKQEEIDEVRADSVDGLAGVNDDEIAADLARLETDDLATMLGGQSAPTDTPKPKAKAKAAPKVPKLDWAKLDWQPVEGDLPGFTVTERDHKLDVFPDKADDPKARWNWMVSTTSEKPEVLDSGLRASVSGAKIMATTRLNGIRPSAPTNQEVPAS